MASAESRVQHAADALRAKAVAAAEQALLLHCSVLHCSVLQCTSRPPSYTCNTHEPQCIAVIAVFSALRTTPLRAKAVAAAEQVSRATVLYRVVLHRMVLQCVVLCCIDPPRITPLRANAVAAARQVSSYVRIMFIPCSHPTTPVHILSTPYFTPCSHPVFQAAVERTTAHLLRRLEAEQSAAVGRAASQAKEEAEKAAAALRQTMLEASVRECVLHHYNAPRLLYCTTTLPHD